MDLSIIIPVHNLENFITPMLVSLRLQMWNDIDPNIEAEVIFVCDNCTDKTCEKIENFALPNYTVKILECDRRSCGLARNEGLEIAEGEYVWFLDGDDWLINPRAVLMVANTMREYDFEMMRVDYDYSSMFQFYGHPAMVWQYIYRRDLIGETRFKEIQPDEDLYFNREIREKLQKKELPFMSIKLYYYNYMREGSNMQQLFTKGKIDS